jgi:hypothetical protein
MKHKVSELEGALLDAAVALCEGFELDADGDNLTHRDTGGMPTIWKPSTVWLQGGQIIERELVGFDFTGTGWIAWHQAVHGGDNVIDGPTPLIAAMRAFVASKLGDEIELLESRRA